MYQYTEAIGQQQYYSEGLLYTVYTCTFQETYAKVVGFQ